jgi:hypothetical protein
VAAFFYRSLSVQEDEQYVTKFLKILESLEENTLSYLFQKGVFPGDKAFQEYDRRVQEDSLREAIIKSLLRPGSSSGLDEETLKQAAVLLLTLCREASQIFTDTSVNTAPQVAIRSAIIALGYHLALIDRITGYLNLPSINDKAFWRLLTVKAAAPSPPSPAASVQKTIKSSTPPTLQSRSAAPPKRKDKTQQKPLRDVKPSEPAPTYHAPSVSCSTEKQATANAIHEAPPKTLKAKTPDTPTNKAAVAKPEGPIKAMVRRIVKEIDDNSYDAVIKALKDTSMMASLYKAADDPLPVKIIEVNSKERVVYLIKQKMGQAEPVTFRLIRKVLNEL